MSNKTIAQQLNIKEFPFIITDKNRNIIYYEKSDGIWYKYEYDSNGNKTYFENSKGYWRKKEYHSNGMVKYYENSDGFWFKKEFDSNGNEIYFENSDCIIKDDRPKVVELTLDEIAAKLNIPVEHLKIKK